MYYVLSHSHLNMGECWTQIKMLSVDDTSDHGIIQVAMSCATSTRACHGDALHLRACAEGIGYTANDSAG